jgi:ankyrin repeat protein
MALSILEMEQRTNHTMEAMVKAIENNNYQAMLTLFEQPEFDINQYATKGCHANLTLVALAIHFKKPELVELFLLMGANPYGGHADQNPINLIDFTALTQASSSEISNLLLRYQQSNHPPDMLNIPDYDASVTDAFIAAVKAGQHATVKRMLDGGLIYTDQCRFDIIDTAFALAVESGCYKTVALLLQRGAAISDAQVRAHLDQNKTNTRYKGINQLIRLEKQKQTDIMFNFVSEWGNLETCRAPIHTIRETYHKHMYGPNLSFYQIMENLITETERNKRALVYQTAPHARVTRFFPKHAPHPLKSTYAREGGLSHAQRDPNQPTLFTPWGKALCPHDARHSEDYDTYKTTVLGALISILIQVCVDVLGALSNLIMLIPNLMFGIYFALSSLFVHNNDLEKNRRLLVAQESFAAPALIPYFAISIAVDLLRECSALLTRTYATCMQTPEEEANPIFSMG